jgi:lipopolysaccharide assembly outer membrane protein LptD (OstA)
MNRLIKLLFAFTITLLVLIGQANAQVNTQYLLWNRVEVSAKLPHKFKLSAEVQERYYLSTIAQHQLLLRAIASYDLKNNWSVFTGYTYFLQSPNDPEATPRLMVPEHRMMNGFLYTQKINDRLSLNHRYQFEERFFRNSANGELTDGYRFVFRTRYRIILDIKITKKEEAKGTLLLRISDELHLQAGQSVKGQPFDQNRISASLQYNITNNIAIDAGYTNWYQQRSGNKGFYNRHIFMASVLIKLDLSKKRPKTT